MQQYLRENPDFADLIRKTRNFEVLDYSPSSLLTEKGIKDIGGAEDVTVMLANTKGYCAESNFPSRERNQDRFIHSIKKLFERKISRDATGFCLDIPEERDPTSAIIDPVLRGIAMLYEKELDKKCKRKPLPAPLVPVMKKYADSLPEYRARLSKGEVKREESEKALIGAIDEALDNSRVAAIGYSANLIMAPDPGERD